MMLFLPRTGKHPEMMNDQEKAYMREDLFDQREYNIHYWLRQVFLFIALLPRESTVKVDEVPENDLIFDTRYKDKGASEKALREHLRLQPVDIITREDALKACKMLYRMFREPFEKPVQEAIDDPRCAGGKPRGSTSG